MWVLLTLICCMACKNIGCSSEVDSAWGCGEEEQSFSCSEVTSVGALPLELGNELFFETSSSYLQRLRRVGGDEFSLRNIFEALSKHEDMLVHGHAKLYYWNKFSCRVWPGSDYYIYMLRRILI